MSTLDKAVEIAVDLGMIWGMVLLMAFGTFCIGSVAADWWRERQRRKRD